MFQALRLADFNQAADFLDGTRRTGRSLPHAERWWEKTGRNLSNAKFKTAFRCRKTALAELVRKLYGTTGMCRGGTRGPQFDPCEKVAIFMYRVGSDQPVRHTALQFGLSEGAVSQDTREVALLVEEHLKAECVRWPSLAEQRTMAETWELEKGLRNVAGAIDGSHIATLAPPSALQQSHYNYKGCYSISLLTIVDQQGMFRWFCSGQPGACGESGVLKDTDLFARVEVEQENPAESRQFLYDGACILGDSAFAESTWMRTPIAKPSSRVQRLFNFKHFSQRFRVEHAFGRLKKFPMLSKGLDCHLDHCSTILNACVVLHNFIFLREGRSPIDEGIDHSQTKNGTGHAAAGAGPVDSARAREVEYLAERFMLDVWGAPGSRADRARLEDERRMRGENETSF